MVFFITIENVNGFDQNYQKNIEEIKSYIIDEVQISENSTPIPSPSI